MAKSNRYAAILERIFLRKYKKGIRELQFKREDIDEIAKELRLQPVKNLGDLIYSFRFRAALPTTITSTAPEGFEWIIRLAGKAIYKFVLAKETFLKVSENFSETKILDATPGIIEKYAMTDEQALLAKVRYNRLIDTFTGLTCYSLQNHFRTTVPGIGQVETDELYVGVDKRGVHFIIPVQAKGGNDKLGIVQIEQDFAIGAAKFPNLLCKPIAAQFMASGAIALFEFEMQDMEITVNAEKHYRLVGQDELSDDELTQYRGRSL